jgi:hypothetical protein
MIHPLSDVSDQFLDLVLIGRSHVTNRAVASGHGEFHFVTLGNGKILSPGACGRKQRSQQDYGRQHQQPARRHGPPASSVLATNIKNSTDDRQQTSSKERTNRRDVIGCRMQVTQCYCLIMNGAKRSPPAARRAKMLAKLLHRMY